MKRRVSRRHFLGTGAGAAASTVLAGCAHTTPLVNPTSGPSSTECADGTIFSNWAGTISCRPSRFCKPASEEEVVAIVKDAAARGVTVRTVGAGHSWAPLALTRDVLVNLDRMEGLSVDTASRTATVQAGIRLKNLTPRLAEHGLGMANLGSIREQSLAGATATGTHGTGLSLGSIHTSITRLRLVTGTGDVRTLTATDGDLFRAACVSLGALGIITEVTIQCVPNYDLEYAAYWCRLDEVLPRIDALVRQNTRLRLWWLVPELGDRDRVILTTMNPPGTGTGILGELAVADDRRPPSRGGKGLQPDTDMLARNAPPRTEQCPRVLHFVDNYLEVLKVPLLPVPHRECEYAIPVEHTVEALRRFRVALDEGGLGLKLPIEVRFVAKDDTLIGPARGRDVCYIGASTQTNATEVFQRFEPIMRALGGRPHWGKCFSLTREDARAMYPDSFDRFREIRKELDPHGVFANDHLRRLFD
jgi:FAD/FMN-containing dehydrogenase